MSMLDDIGGEASLHELVEAFYDLIETLPEASNLRRLYADKLNVAFTRVAAILINDVADWEDDVGATE